MSCCPGLAASELPKTESLKLTVDRVLPFWESDIVPAIKSGKKVRPPPCYTQVLVPRK
jgi:bisphosphoglycerate-dependent phosphoglycerate mutase